MKTKVIPFPKAFVYGSPKKFKNDFSCRIYVSHNTVANTYGVVLEPLGLTASKEHEFYTHLKSFMFKVSQMIQGIKMVDKRKALLGATVQIGSLGIFGLKSKALAESFFNKYVEFVEITIQKMQEQEGVNP